MMSAEEEAAKGVWLWSLLILNNFCDKEVVYPSNSVPPTN
jgi:hypothetical protein